MKPARATLKLRDCVVRSARLFMEDGEREVDLEEDGPGTVIRVPLSEIAVLEAIVDSVPRSCYSATSTLHFSSPSVKRQPRRLTRACHLAVGTRGILTASPASFMPIPRLRLRAGVLDMESGESRMNTFLPHMIPGPNLIGPRRHDANAPLTAECTRNSKENAPGPVGSRRLFGGDGLERG